MVDAQASKKGRLGKLEALEASLGALEGAADRTYSNLDTITNSVNFDALDDKGRVDVVIKLVGALKDYAKERDRVFGTLNEAERKEFEDYAQKLNARLGDWVQKTFADRPDATMEDFVREFQASKAFTDVEKRFVLWAFADNELLSVKDQYEAALVAISQGVDGPVAEAAPGARKAIYLRK